MDVKLCYYPSEIPTLLLMNLFYCVETYKIQDRNGLFNSRFQRTFKIMLNDLKGQNILYRDFVFIHNYARSLIN